MVGAQPLGAQAPHPSLGGPCLPSPERDSLHRRPVVTAAKAPTSWAATSADETTQGGFEPRVEQLERDLRALNCRLRDECGISDDMDGTFETFVERLEASVIVERRTREDLADRIRLIEEVILEERKERDVQLRTFSSELEATMQGLVNRIDEGLSAGAATMRERTDQTEARLRSLIERVDAGLSAGAAALQDTLVNNGRPVAEVSLYGGECEDRGHPHDRLSATTRLQPYDTSTHHQPPTQEASKQKAPATFQPGPRSLRPANGLGTRSPDVSRPPLVKAASPAAVSPNCTPSLAFPSTLQVPGSGLGSTSPPAASQFAPRSQGGTPGSRAGRCPQLDLISRSNC